MKHLKRIYESLNTREIEDCFLDLKDDGFTIYIREDGNRFEVKLNREDLNQLEVFGEMAEYFLSIETSINRLKDLGYIFKDRLTSLSFGKLSLGLKFDCLIKDTKLVATNQDLVQFLNQRYPDMNFKINEMTQSTPIYEGEVVGVYLHIPSRMYHSSNRNMENYKIIITMPVKKWEMSKCNDIIENNFSPEVKEILYNWRIDKVDSGYINDKYTGYALIESRMWQRDIDNLVKLIDALKNK